MKSTLAGVSALALCAGILSPAWAADDVFQPACFWRPNTAGSSPVVAYSAPIQTAAPCSTCQQPACSSCQQPACSSCQQSACSTKYVQQSYYQAVTSYQTQTYYEPVTSYQTSYYYEPVTTYRTSYYFDPNCCSYKQTSTPETSYQLKTKSCPVQSYVAKCQQVPVTTYQKAYYLQPQTTCCQTTVGGAISVAQPQYAQPVYSSPPPVQQPPVIEEHRTPNPNTNPNPSYYTPPAQPLNDKSTPAPPITNKPGSTSWQPAEPLPPPPSFPETAPTPVTSPARSVPAVRIERIVLGSDASVEGQLVRGDNTPRADVKVLFVNANDSNLRSTTKTNDAGRFQVTLASGGWLVHIYSPDGVPVFHSRVEVSDEPGAARIVLVNR